MISKMFNIISLVVILLFNPSISISDSARGELWARSSGNENDQPKVSARAEDEDGNYVVEDIHEKGENSDDEIIRNIQNLNDTQSPSSPTGLRVR